MNKTIYEMLRQQDETVFNAYMTAKHNSVVLTYNDDTADKALKQLDKIREWYLVKKVITLDESMKMITEV